MTDTEATDGMFSPDGWGVYHQWDEPVEDVPGYMFGPFPTHDIAAYVMAASPCKCVTSLVPLMFPKGMVMGIGVDMNAAPQEHPVLPDRVH
jgi:hypothetical protein